MSRADLARMMSVRRGAVSLIVNDLIADGLIFEGATGEAVRGRKPTFLYIDSRRRAVVAADIRASETFLMLADLVGNPLDRRHPHARPSAIRSELVTALAARIAPAGRASRGRRLRRASAWSCPAWSNTRPMRVIHAPTLGWRNVDLRGPLAAATGLPVQIENSGRACALAQAWAMRDGDRRACGDLVFVSVSDGVGVGVIDSRRVAARAPQHRRRVRPRAAVARWPALLVRRERLLGSLHLESRDARPLLRPPAEPTRSGRARAARSSRSTT